MSFVLPIFLAYVMWHCGVGGLNISVYDLLLPSDWSCCFGVLLCFSFMFSWVPNVWVLC